MSFTSTMHYVVLLISNKNLPLKKKNEHGMKATNNTILNYIHFIMLQLLQLIEN